MSRQWRRTDYILPFLDKKARLSQQYMTTFVIGRFCFSKTHIFRRNRLNSPEMAWGVQLRVHVHAWKTCEEAHALLLPKTMHARGTVRRLTLTCGKPLSHLATHPLGHQHSATHPDLWEAKSRECTEWLWDDLWLICGCMGGDRGRHILLSLATGLAENPAPPPRPRGQVYLWRTLQPHPFRMLHPRLLHLH